MGERRKRKSLWDTEEETRHFSGTGENNSWTGKEHYSSNDGEHYHEFSASGSYRAQKFRDHSGKPYLKLIEENPVAPVNGSFIKRRENTPDGSFIKHREDTPERKEIGGGNRYYENMSPGFKYSHSLGNDRSHSHRYLGRGRSRSRTRGRSHSRSLSRGREREKVRGRSRSRSRSRSDGSARGQTRSRSPIRDYRQSYRWSDRRSLPEKATEICSDFAAGRCRRGSQCKYFHPKDIIHRDADLVGADTSESWRSRADHGRISRHSYSSRGPRSELRDDVSDPYHGEDEQFQNKSRSAVPCKDFMKGKCRWGDTCRFSHHFASDETFGKGTRYMSSDKDIEHQPYKNGKPLCKYFAAGKCDRDNCRFSHEDSRYNSREGRQGKLTDDHSLHDKGNKRNGPTWNDATSFTGNVKPSGWNEFTVTNNHGDNTNGKNDNRWSHSWGNENINWGIPDQTDNLIDRDKRTSPPAGNGSYSGDLGTAESISKGNMANKQELLMLPHSQSQNQDGNLNVQVQNKLPEEERFSVRTWQQTVSPVSRIQQQDHGVVENNVESSFQSDVLDVMKDSRNAINPIPLSGQDKSQNGEHAFTGHSSIPSETDSGLNMHCPNPSDVFSGDFRGPGIHLLANLNLQSQMQNHQKAIQMTGMLETKVPQFFPNLINSERSASLASGTDQQVAPVTIPIMFPTQGTENEHSRKNTDTQVSGSMGMELSSSDASGHVPLVGNTNLQSNPLRVSHDPINPMENGRGINEQEKHTEQGNEMQGGPSSPVSIVGMEPGSSEVCHSGRSVVKLETVLANSEVDEAKRAIGEESKGVKNNKDSETLDGYGKAEENNANKDDKAMRLFKNSLIEFVKDILKPTWKEGRMSREVHKTIVKKVVDKVTSTIQVDHIPRTQDKVEQYLSYSKPKIAKLIQAYIDRSLKTDS